MVEGKKPHRVGPKEKHQRRLGCRRSFNRVPRESQDFITRPFVERYKLRLQWFNLVAAEYARRSVRGAEPACIARHDPKQLGRHAVRGQQVVTRDGS